jgi:hypothetical protein
MTGRVRWSRFAACALAATIAALPAPSQSQNSARPRTDTRKPAVPTPAVLPPRRPDDLPRPAAPTKPQDAARRTPPASSAPASDKPAELDRSEPARTGEAAGIAVPALPAPLLCTAGLSASHGDGVSPVDPAKLHARLEPGCHVEEPVIVRSLTIRQGETTQRLAFDPPATIACPLAAALARWAETGLQPLAQGHFGRALTGLRVGGGHECRRRNRSSTGPLSEHSTGRALDIFAFVLAEDGQDERPRGGTGKEVVSVKAAATTAISVERPTGPAQLAFLEAVRQSACGAFMTVLGPGSDAAHANHIHLDIQARRSGASRFCQ